MELKQRYTPEGEPTTDSDTALPERQPFIDRVAEHNPVMTTEFLALGDGEIDTDQDGNAETIPSAETLADQMDVKNLEQGKLAA